MRIYFASAGQRNRDRKLRIAGVKHRMASYYEYDGILADAGPGMALALSGADPDHVAARDRAVQRALDLIHEHSDGVSWVVDSGAHTYQQPRFHVPRQALMAYAERYIDFCRRAGTLLDWCAELDVEEVYGDDFVEEVWAKMLDAGLPALRVWHVWRGPELWRRYCQEREFVGIGGPFPLDHIAQVCRYAYANGNKVHLFGIQDQRLMKLPAFSADGISWLSGAAWGQIVTFDRRTGRLVRTSPKKSKKLDVTAIRAIADSRQRGYDAATYATIRELHAYEDYITRSWAERGVDFNEPEAPTWQQQAT